MRTNIEMVGYGKAGHCPKCGSSKLHAQNLTCLVEISPHQFSPKIICLACRHEFVEDTRMTPEMLEAVQAVEEVFALKRDRMADAVCRHAIVEKFANEPVSPQEINQVLQELYAVRGDASREHTLVFWGTPDEFAFFKARLCEWAKKRVRDGNPPVT